MFINIFFEFHPSKGSYFFRSKLFCLCFVLLISSGLLNLSGATAAASSSSLKHEVVEQGFRRSLVEIGKLVSQRQRPLTCFISRVCEDEAWGDRIESYLRQIGIQTIYDKKDLRGNDNIPAFIDQINTVDFVMTLFSPRYLENYGKGTWIYKEADLIKQRLLRKERGFHIPVLLVGRAKESMPSDFFDPTQTLYYPMIKGEEHLTDEEEVYEGLFRVLKEQLFRGDFEEGSEKAVIFARIKENLMQDGVRFRPHSFNQN